MGMFDEIELGDEIFLPKFPIHIKPNTLEWQTKDLCRTMKEYKISNDGRLLRKEIEKGEMSQEELNETARKRTDGRCETWEEWEKSNDVGTIGPLDSWKKKIVDEWWVDHNQHGTIEFHSSGRGVAPAPDVYWSYEARFYRGDLEKIVFMDIKN